jgi:hypothetical protein
MRALFVYPHTLAYFNPIERQAVTTQIFFALVRSNYNGND